MTAHYVETVIVGGGQQGCAVAASLAEVGRQAEIVEKHTIGYAWSHERWDNLVVGSGNRSVALPGWNYDGDDPDGFMPGHEVAGHLRRYVADRGLAVTERTAVTGIDCLPTLDGDRRFRSAVHTGAVYESRNVVAAVGGYSRPRVPEMAQALDPAIAQLHTRDYRNAERLRPGAVLVVGSGISGQEIAEDLADAGRRVVLSVGRHHSWPRRYRGRSIHEWMDVLGLHDDFVTQTIDVDDPRRIPGLPVVGVSDSGADLNLTTLAGRGVVIVGSVRAVHGQVLELADNVTDVVDVAAASFRRVLDCIDDGLRSRGFAAPEERPRPRYDTAAVPAVGRTLDLGDYGVQTVIWCTGFGPDYPFLPPAAVDEHGRPRLVDGVRSVLPGLYVAGLPADGSVAPTAIAACVPTARTVAAHIHFDDALRTGAERVLLPARPS